MLKRLIALMLIAGSCSGADVILGSITDGFTYSSFDANNVIVSFGGVTPVSALVLEYLMGTNGSESTITLDTSGNDYTGTVVNAVWTGGTNGQLVGYGDYDFDGSGDYIRSPTGASSVGGLSNGFSVSVWANKNRSDVFEGVVYKGGAFNSVNREWYGAFNTVGAGSVDFSLIDSAQGANYIYSRGDDTLCVLGEWHRLQFDYFGGSSATSTAIYIDNTKISGSTAGAGTFNGIADKGGSVWAGGIGASRIYDGKLTALIIYNEVLTASERASLILSEGNTLGLFSGWIAGNAGARSRTIVNVNCNNNFQDLVSSNSMDSTDLPALAGTPDIGWGAGNGVAEHGVIVANNATNLMFSAGATASTMTNYALIDGVKYVNGATHDFTNTFYETTATSNVFWRYDGSTFYAGNISQIHVGSYTEADAQSLDTWIDNNINWTP